LNAPQRNTSSLENNVLMIEVLRKFHAPQPHEPLPRPVADQWQVTKNVLEVLTSDYRRIRLYGKEYRLTNLQAATVRVLVEEGAYLGNEEEGRRHLRNNDLAQKLKPVRGHVGDGVAGEVIHDIFRRQNKELRGTLILSGGRHEAAVARLVDGKVVVTESEVVAHPLGTYTLNVRDVIRKF
jgi:hypothetical protein